MTHIQRRRGTPEFRRRLPVAARQAGGRGFEGRSFIGSSSASHRLPEDIVKRGPEERQNDIDLGIRNPRLPPPREQPSEHFPRKREPVLRKKMR
jgi:hypothetical protein